MIRHLAVLSALLLPASAAAETVCDGGGAEFVGEQHVFYANDMVCDHDGPAGTSVDGELIFPARCFRHADTPTGTVRAPDLAEFRLRVVTPDVGVVTIGGHTIPVAICEAALEPDDINITRRAVVIDPATLNQP